MSVCPSVRTKVFIIKAQFLAVRSHLERSKAALGGLLFVALATTALAGWGLASTALGPGGAQLVARSTTTIGSTSSPVVGPAGGSNNSTNAISTQTTPTTTATASTPPSAQSVTTVISTSTATTVATTTATQNNEEFAALGSTGSGGQSKSLLMEAQADALLLAPVTWILLGGAWVWRGRVRARYSELGFGSDVFELFMKMKGGATRIRVLDVLSTPKDRLQLAQELGVDWKTVDRHVQILNKYGFVREQAAFGTVRLYEATPMGRMLLNLFDDLQKTDGPVSREGQARR